MAPLPPQNDAPNSSTPSSAQPSSTSIKSPNTTNEIPIIDLSLQETNPALLLSQLHQACSTHGFFLLVNHSIPPSQIAAFRQAMSHFFQLPYEEKVKLKRHANNSRGYFDDELTKRRRDWKECLDVGRPGGGDWDSDKSNVCLDGCNQFPTPAQIPSFPNFRETIIQYFEECARLSDVLARLMARALGVMEGTADEELLDRMKREHTSYLRMNYYPPCQNGQNDNTESTYDSIEPPPLGISPHRDAGFLTVLLQDDDCHSLQVARCDDQSDDSEDWVTIHPVPGSLTINTGDMAMIWSNGIFRAPLHRVLTDPTKERYSAPFFYNPGYDELISPLSCCCSRRSGILPRDDNGVDRVGAENGVGGGVEEASKSLAGVELSNNNVSTPQSPNQLTQTNRSLQPIQYHPCLWGYFRALRFAGDLTDLGVEIQTSHYKVGSETLETSGHVERQRKFRDVVDFGEAFDVERYRDILTS